jgi:hypothetical protein
MKKIIGFIVIMFISTGVFGQKFIRSESEFERTENAIHIWNVTDGDYDWVDCVHFIKNDRLYLLSYEPDEEFESTIVLDAGRGRDIYLYSKDINDINSPWIKASDVVTRSIWLNITNYSEVDFFRSEKSRGSKGNVVVDGENIKITIGYELMTNGSVHAEPITFTFTPIKDGFYFVSNGERSSIQ